MRLALRDALETDAQGGQRCTTAFSAGGMMGSCTGRAEAVKVLDVHGGWQGINSGYFVMESVGRFLIPTFLHTCVDR